MKFSVAFALLVIVVGFVASGDALPARKRMAYYQQPVAAEWYGAAPQQRIMYMQYVQPGRTHARSTQAASALVAGESVATGTYLKETEVALSVDDSSAESAQSDDTLSAAGAHGASSLAEAYPDDVPVVQIAIDGDSSSSTADFEPQPAVVSESDDAAKVPRDFNFAAEEAAPAAPVVPTAEQPAVVQVAFEEEEDLPAPAPIAPVAPVIPVNRYLPAKKKVIVELDQSAEDAEEAQIATIEDEETDNTVADDVEEDDVDVAEPVKPVAKHPARVPNARRPVAKKPAAGAGKPAKKPAPLPAGTFFPIDFGGTNGGAIAIANSFSTGEGGSATSHAIAYGSPDAARARVRPGPSKRRH
ncbi:translation initiation factor IF-2 isoform X2 [Drosophila grimshawi]|uniref:translation initiation factor IF-2 isoform X2 n=1 Tax=Drosophila grimshawi TaxID=7222 RepID=UPI000C86EEB8|nr:translation initiation factor IF-2 isoform X2 [Drosophila grimshawi]